VNGSAPVTQRLVVGITGASGSIYGIRLLELLRERDEIESHLVLSRAGALTLRQETGRDPDEIRKLADVNHSPGDIGATLASGSFAVHGMIVAPCSIKTLSAIANCYSGDLMSRAADVTLKEGRPLVLMVRESPLHLGHLRLMTAVTEAGGIIAPPLPAFYHQPTTIDELVDHSVRRVIDRVGLDGGGRSWGGLAPD
jgi:flavin prenyltransferase